MKTEQINIAATFVGFLVAIAICLSALLPEPKPVCTFSADLHAVDHSVFSHEVKHPVWTAIRDSVTWNYIGKCFGERSVERYQAWTPTSYLFLLNKSYVIYHRTKKIVGAAFILLVFFIIVHIMFEITLRRK